MSGDRGQLQDTVRCQYEDVAEVALVALGAWEDEE